MAIVLPVRQHTDAWLTAREKGIGASQAAAAIGLDPWQSPIGLWAEKLKLVPPPAENVAMRIGTELEPLIARLYTEATGLKVRRANNLRQHPTHTFMLASLDRRAGRRTVELKYSARATGYGEPGTDEVPDHVLIQVLHQLAVLDEDEADVALLRAGAESVAIYPIRRDPAAEASIVEREATFWDHVLARTEPPVDGSEATRRTLNALYQRVEDRVIEEPAELLGAMAALRHARREIDQVEAERAELEAQIKAAMLAAGATVIRAPGVGEIPWRPTKDRETTDWKGLAGRLGAALRFVDPTIDIDAETAAFTTTKESAPRFGPARWEGDK